MLYVNGIIIIVRKAGILSENSLSLIFLTGLIINDPTRINAGAVAAAGTIKNTGAKNKAITKNTAVKNAVSPVLPPSVIPAALST